MMISANFYPTDYTSDRCRGEITRTIQNIPITTQYLPDAYWLFWLAYNNLPNIVGLSQVVEDDERFIIRPIVKPENFKCTYLSQYASSTGSGTIYPDGIHINGYDTNDSRWENVNLSYNNTSFQYSRFINALDVQCASNSAGSFRFRFAVMAGNSIDTMTTSYYYYADVANPSIAQILSAINGDGNLGTYTINNFAGSGESKTIELKIPNDDETFLEENGIIGERYYRCVTYITRFKILYNQIAPIPDTGSSSIPYLNVCGAICLHDNYEREFLYTTNGLDRYSHGSLTDASIQVNTNTFSWTAGTSTDYSHPFIPATNDIPYTFGWNLDCNFSKYALYGLANGNWIISGNVIARKYGNSAILNVAVTKRDIRFILASQPRLLTTNAYGINSSVYMPKISDNDELTGEFLNGETLADIQPELKYWQYTNLNENVFSEKDVPEYYPTPTEDDTDSGGDDIRAYDWTNLRISAANNFVTLYGMTANTVIDFGRQMWSKLSDPAFWQLVGTAFTNDFSINPADMMKYFISLRYFPFNLTDFPHSTATGVYIGRATTPIAPTAFQDVPYPIRITNNVVQIDGGRLTIRRYYNDFRDYEPCTTVQIHVPFCGCVDIPASEIMNHELDITYKIDLQTGAMLAVIGVTSDTYYVIATLAGTCGATIPITANNNIEFLQRIATVGAGTLNSGMSGALKGAAIGGEIGAVAGAVAGAIGGGIGAMAGLPPVTVHKQGNASGFANLGGVPYAYATVQRGRFARPDNYGHTTGYACDFSATVGSLMGFVVCDNVDTSGLTCNATERNEIKRLLESGIYV